jgi:pyruvate,water dikinase
LFLNKEKSVDARAVVKKHKSEIECLDNVKLPSIIYGDDPPTMCESNASILIGVPVSLGIYTGRVCCVKSEADFGKLKQGEVLVIPYSDVSWSPLFARAGALISESGGLLSHGSIVAREYNLPAIVSVEHATSLRDGTMVRVDAHQGIVQIL